MINMNYMFLFSLDKMEAYILNNNNENYDKNMEILKIL